MKILPINVATKRLNIVGKLDDYATEMIRELSPQLHKLADYNPIKVAQKDDLLLINSGARTSFLNLKEMESSREIMRTFIENVHQNAKLNTNGSRINYIG